LGWSSSGPEVPSSQLYTSAARRAADSTGVSDPSAVQQKLVSTYDDVELTVGADIDEVDGGATAGRRPPVHQMSRSADVLVAAV
jgi:hypothetical protein